VTRLLLACALVTAWCAFALVAEVSVYETSDEARLEVESEGFPIAAAVGGRVVATNLRIGRDVERGEVLVELDSRTEQLALAEVEAQVDALEPQIAALGSEVGAERVALADSQHAAAAALDEARARLNEAEVAARHADDEVRRSTKLQESGQLSDRDLDRARTDADVKRAAVETARITVGRLEWEQRTQESDRRVRLESHTRDHASAEGERAKARAAAARIRYEIEKRRIVAPVAGRLGEVASLRIGGVVQAGERLGAVVPAGRLRVVAELTPAAALGRVRPGQPARLRLTGFPWAEYGTVAAKVERVASEVRAGRVRVELAVDGERSFAVPLEHGLPGRLEIEVERTTPATLILRAAGQALAVRDGRGGGAPR
jgi:membrane fusion protein (multidrug efflux system)